MKLYRALQDGSTSYLSPEPIRPDDLSAPCLFDEIDRDVPIVDARLTLWDGSDGLSYSHLHYQCPRCAHEQNVDLYLSDANPRFACCDSCGWDSVVWLRWNAELTYAASTLKCNLSLTLRSSEQLRPVTSAAPRRAAMQQPRQSSAVAHLWRSAMLRASRE